MTDEKIIVTGGAGFIGRRVCSELANRGIETLSLDNLITGTEQNQDQRVKYIFADIRNKIEVEEIFKEFRPDGVIHLAAIHHIPTCEKKPAEAMDVNITGTQNVLTAMETFKVKKLVLASSGAVYRWSDSQLSEQTSPVEPCDYYALTKATNETQAELWTNRFEGKANVARIFNTIGHDDPNSHLIPDIVKQIPQGQKSCSIMLGNTSPKRDYLHADDTALGLVSIYNAISDESEAFNIFNLCSGKESSVRDLVEVISRIMDVEIEIKTDPSRVRKIDRPSQVGCPQKSLRELGWAPKSDFYDAVRKTIEQNKATLSA